MPRAIIPLEIRLWAKTLINGDDECWEWQGWRHPFGHGQIGRGSREDGLAYTHVVSWEIANRRCVPDGMIVRHTCDNPPCVNPAHLLLGTKADNSRDMVARRRHKFGETVSTSRLKEAGVLEIRRRAEAGEAHWAIAKDFNVSRSLVTAIFAKKRWAHLR